MKAMRKLIPALAMLLIAGIVATSATYAWFSMNTQVSATGMQIKATTSKNLLISLEQGANFGPTVGISTGTQTMIPCSSTATTTDTDAAIFTMSDRGTGMSADRWQMGTNATFTDATVTTHYVKTMPTSRKRFMSKRWCQCHFVVCHAPIVSRCPVCTYRLRKNYPVPVGTSTGWSIAIRLCNYFLKYM